MGSNPSWGTQNENNMVILNDLTETLIKEMFKDDSFLYMMLGSIISADNVMTIEEAEEGLSFLCLFEQELQNSDKTQEEKDKLLEFVEKGKQILNQDIEHFKTIGK